MTELIWNSKHDENGNLKPVDRTILPFQVVETINGWNRVRPRGRSRKGWLSSIAQRKRRLRTKALRG